MKLLVCGTRKAGYRDLVWRELQELYKSQSLVSGEVLPFEIIEGCCPDSADAYAEEWADKWVDIKVNHFPSTPGNYLKRNIEMVEQADQVIAFWNGMSYGTAHTIAHAVKKGIPVRIVEVK